MGRVSFKWFVLVDNNENAYKGDFSCHEVMTVDTLIVLVYVD